MATGRIEWLQRVCGRRPGDVELSELDTPFARGLVANRRVRVLQILEPEKSVEPIEDVDRPADELPGEAVAELQEIVLAKPRPVKPRGRETPFGKTDLSLGNTD